MPPAAKSRATTAAPLVAVAGNPNTGKTTLFNALTGSTAKVGNYPGITVELHEGRMRVPEARPRENPTDDRLDPARPTGPGFAREVRLLDVPGCYSLAARSAEERIALSAVAGIEGLERPACVLVVVDATQLSRNLYLTLQVLGLGLPVVVALTMVDVVDKKGHAISAQALGEELGVEVVEVTAATGRGLDALRAAVARAVERPTAPEDVAAAWAPDEAVVEALDRVAQTLPASWDPSGPRRRALASWAVLSIDDEDEHEGLEPGLRAAVASERERASERGVDLEQAIVAARYEWIDERTGRFHPSGERRVHVLTDRLDRLLLHPAVGFLLFLTLMTAVFQALFSWSDPLISAVEWVVTGVGAFLSELLPQGFVHDLVVDGLVDGVGAVLVFLPQILLLFLFIGVMEDTGYMSRVAFLMDRVMRAIGLHGRAFVPMLSGFACAVPAILATRTMERRRDRLLTMMVVPLMTCSARLPVYTLIIAVLARPGGVAAEDAWPVQGLLMAAMYVFSTLLALVVAAVLARTVLRGPRVPLILEMPPYRRPHWPSVLRMLRERTMGFLRDAGGVILVASLVMWGLLAFPSDPELARDFAGERSATRVELAGADLDALEERLAQLDAEEAAERLAASYGGRLGRTIEPVIEPLGFDWKIGVGLVGAFAAREVFVSTMGVTYGIGDEVDEDAPHLRDKLRRERKPDGTPRYTPLVCLALLVFFALACQCTSTLAVVYRETGGWRWPTFLFAYTFALAWLSAFAVYQGGTLLGF